MSSRLPLLAPLTLSLASRQAFADASPSPKELVERAAEALGGREQITGLPSVRFTVLGSGMSPSAAQARSPRATHNVTQQERTYLIDAKGQRARRESSQLSPGPIRFHTLALATTSGTRTIDLLKWRGGTDIQSQPAAAGRAALASWARLLPHTALQQAKWALMSLEDRLRRLQRP